MLATLCLLGGLLVPAQVKPPTPAGAAAPMPPPTLRREQLPPPPVRADTLPAGDWVLTPHLAAGQELVYRGSYTESASDVTPAARTYRLENRVLVLDTTAAGLELAVLTVFNDDAAPVPGGRVTMKVPAEAQPRSARIERIVLDAQGRPAASRGVALTVPLEGPATLECGFSVGVPATRLAFDRPWLVQEAGRPDSVWKVAGSEAVGGTGCLRLVGVQKSDDWDKPRAERIAWRRTDAVWVSPRDGVARKVERRIEHRPAGATAPTRVGILRYDLQSSMQYPVVLIDNCRREIRQTLQLQESARPLLEDPARNASRLDPLLLRAKTYLDSQSLTPYRQALVSLRQRLEAARRGETPPSILPSVQAPVPAPEPPPLRTGERPVPDFVAADVTDPGRTVSIKQLRGHPALLVFYNPDSRNLLDLMQLVEDLTKKHPEVRVIALAMSSDRDRVTRQRKEKGWKFPVVNGGNLRALFAVDCTPTLLLIDTRGTLQGTVVGWGDETHSEVAAKLPRWLGR